MGQNLLMRDFNIFATTKTNHRAILEQLKQMALNRIILQELVL